MFLVNQKDSDWKKGLVKEIFATTLLGYGQTKEFTDYQKALLATPEQVVIPSNGRQPLRTVHISKVFIHLLVLHGQKGISKQQLENVFQYAFIYFFKQKIEQHGVDTLFA